MSAEEWSYLLFTRRAATVNGVENARFAKANYVSGDNKTPVILIFPDDYIQPTNHANGNLLIYKPKGINDAAADFSINEYNYSSLAQMEKNGCVILMSRGVREYDDEGVPVINEGSLTFWSSSANGDEAAFALKADASSLGVVSMGRQNGAAVRLVRDVE